MSMIIIMIILYSLTFYLSGNAYNKNFIIFIIIVIPVFLLLLSRPESSGNDLANYYIWIDNLKSITEVKDIAGIHPDIGFSLVLYPFTVLESIPFSLALFQFYIYIVIAFIFFIKGGVQLVFYIFVIMFFSRLYLDFSSNAIRGSMSALLFSLIFVVKNRLIIFSILVLALFFHWKQFILITPLFLFMLININFFSKMIFSSRKNSFMLILLFFLILYFSKIIMYPYFKGINLSNENISYFRISEGMYDSIPISIFIQVLSAIVIPYFIWIYQSIDFTLRSTLMKFTALILIGIYFLFVNFYPPVERVLMYVIPIIYVGLCDSRETKLIKLYIILILLPLNIYGIVSFYGY